MRNVALRSAALSLLLVSLWSERAPADPPTGSRLGHSEVEPGVKLTDKDMELGGREMARCIYARHRNIAEALLNSPSGAASKQVMDRLQGEQRCFSVYASNDLVDTRIVSFPPDVLRGMFAELELKDARERVASLPALPLEQKRYTRPWFDATGRNDIVDEMAACIADTNPAGIMELLDTDVRTAKENAAVGALGPSLGACLAAGATLQATREAMRAALADALYQRLRDPALSLAPTPKAEAQK